MIQYVLGFAFVNGRVTLIQKTKPEWQEGRWNGVGGKIEHSDFYPAMAMAREFFEETGVPNSPEAWVRFAELSFGDCKIHCFATGLIGVPYPRTMTEERVDTFALYELPVDLIPNLHWLIPMAVNCLRGIDRSIHYIQ